MQFHTWWLFVGMTFIVSATPGPNMLLIMTHSARFGIRRAMFTMAGCMSALLAMMSLSAAGLGALLQAFPAVFNVLRLGGALYLAWLGIKCWRAQVQVTADTQDAVTADVSRFALYREGVLVAASNPKAILFAAAFLPQFIDPTAPKLGQFAVLLATFSVIEITWYLIYAGGGRTLASRLREVRVMKLFNRITGGVFVGFAALMAGARH